MDVTGHIIYSKEYNANRIVEKIDLSGYSKGVYFVKVYSNYLINLEKIMIY